MKMKKALHCLSRRANIYFTSDMPGRLTSIKRKFPLPLEEYSGAEVAVTSVHPHYKTVADA